MQHSVFDLVVTQPIRSLNALKGILRKAQKHAAARKFDENLFLQLRLAPDMFAFARQVQIVSDGAKGTAARLSGRTAPAFPDEEKTIEELCARIDKTLDYLKGFKPEDFQGYEKREITFPWNPGVKMLGVDLLSSHGLPNFYFHLTTAYALLRSAGVELGKGDYLGEQNWLKA